MGEGDPAFEQMLGGEEQDAGGGLSFGGDVILEFVAKEDPMSRRLLLNKVDQLPAGRAAALAPGRPGSVPGRCRR